MLICTANQSKFLTAPPLGQDSAQINKYPSRRPKAKNLKFQHLRRFVMLSVLARQPSSKYAPFEAFFIYTYPKAYPRIWA
jgi:hypothetical protein